MSTTIGDALGISYRGAEANASHIGRSEHSFKALSVSTPIAAPSIPTPGPSISNMIAKAHSQVGDNIDVFA